MATKSESLSNTRRYNPKKSIKRARARKLRSPGWHIGVAEGKYVWATKMDRINIIRKGLPYEAIEVISKRANLPVK